MWSVVEREALEAWVGRPVDEKKNGEVEGPAVLVRTRNKCSWSKSIIRTRRLKVCGMMFKVHREKVSG